MPSSTLKGGTRLRIGETQIYKCAPAWYNVNGLEDPTRLREGMTAMALDRQKPSTRREILHVLRRRGSLSVDELAAALGITPMGIRQHLAILERDNLVASTHVRRGVGRPTHLYSLTGEAEELFPKAYGEFAKSLIDGLVALDGLEKLEQLLGVHSDRMVEMYAGRIGEKDFAGKVRQFVAILEEHGAMPEIEPLGEHVFSIKENNCSIRQLAEAYPVICDYELKVVERVLGVPVTREECVAHGGKTCRYRVGEVK